MLRRIILIAGLLAPLAAWAQTAGTVVPTPSTFGTSACANTAGTPVSLAWTVAISGSNTVTSGDTFQVQAVTGTTCPGTIGGTSVVSGGGSLAVVDDSGSFSTAALSDYLTAAGLSASCPTSSTSSILICVSAVSGSTIVGTASGTMTFQFLPPPVPILNQPQPGNGKLYLSWKDGTSNSVAVAHYTILATGTGTTSLDLTTHTQDTSDAGRSFTFSGLTNGQEYSVTVASVSAGGNTSLPSNALSAVPQLTLGFWEIYQQDTGVEQGGCAGGAGGLLSLTFLAGLGFAFRRRS